VTCLQGASAVERILEQHAVDQRVLVVWEPVLPTDWFGPSTFTLKRVPDARVEQYWDPGRLLSKAMGEHDRPSVVWDWVGVYSRDAVWEAAPPKPMFQDAPVVRVVEGFTRALEQAARTGR